jgi:hypothetical protein
MISHFKSNWYKFFGTAVVAICAIYTTWHQTQPNLKTKTVTEKVIEGDGVLTEKQCRDLDPGTSKWDLRDKYGYPASDGNDDNIWYYPLRDKDDMYCNVSLGYSTGFLDSGDNRIVKVTMDLSKD